MAKRQEKTKEKQHVELMWKEGIRVGTGDEEWYQKYSYIANSSTKRYYNCLYLLCKLSPCARTLMDYYSEDMNDDNMVDTHKGARDGFNEFMLKITKGKVGYSDIAIKKAISELKVKNLIAQISIGRAKVNPLYFFKGSDAKRIENIKLIIKIGSGLKEGEFVWHGKDVLDDSKLPKHRRIAQSHDGVILNGDVVDELMKKGFVEKEIKL